MSEGDARRRGGSLEGRNAGDDLEGDAGGLEGLGLLAPAAEDQRIPAFEACHSPS